ncbi:MAG: SurA N-terminal domain-containing protein [Myxococcales bacterium]|nr:SurA N-terminal domain-containing protein [Myxococcales bacterium]
MHIAKRAALLLALVIAPLAAGSRASARELVDGIAAQVGDEIVLISEVEAMIRPYEKRMRDQGATDADIQVMRGEVLERLIEQRLVSTMVKRLELSATDPEVDEAIASIARDAGISVPQLVRSVTSHGLSVAEYREKLRSEIERSKVINGMVRSRVKVGEGELRALYAERHASQPSGGEEVYLRHILVASGTDSLRDQDTACAIAAEGRERISRGEISFPALAREISDVNGERGGDMGWIHTSEIAAWMAPVVRGIGDRGVSDVVVMPFGCNLLEVVERRSFRPVSFEDARPELEQEIGSRKTEQEYVKWIESVRAETYIERKGVYAEGARVLQMQGGRR